MPLTQESPPALFLFGFEDVTENVISNVKDVLPTSANHIRERLAISAGVDLAFSTSKEKFGFFVVFF